MIAIGTLILILPISSAEGNFTNVVDALFTATSAVCVTGLVVLDTGTYWSPFGQVVILILIQAGGFGFMTSSTLLLILIGRRARLRDRLLLGQALGLTSPGETLRLVRRIAIFTIGLEALGTFLLTTRLIIDGAPFRDALWSGLFFSISAFNNAGFDISGDFQSLIPYQHDPFILGTIGMLLVLGGISFMVLADTVSQRRWRRLTIDTKLVLSTTAALVLVGTLMILVLESENPLTLGAMDWPHRIVNALFFSVTPRTAGFNAVDVGNLDEATTFFLMPLMFIGGSAGSTAGGIKLQTFSLLLFAIISALRGRDHVAAFGREATNTQVYRALSVALLAIAILFSVAFTLTLTEQQRFVTVLFESVSALGTVGLSTGITPELSTPGRLIIAGAMFAGRLGPLTLALALAARVPRQPFRYAPEPVRIG